VGAEVAIKARIYAVIVALLVLGFIAWGFNKARTESIKAQGQAQAWQAATVSAVKDARLHKADAERAVQEIEAIKKVNAKLPKDPGPTHVPQDPSASEVIANLERYGLHPKLGTGAFPILINPEPDGRMIWTWAGEALRVEPLLQQLAGEKALASATGHKVEALDAQVADLATALDNSQKETTALRRAALLLPRDRPSSVGFLRDTNGEWILTGSHAWGPVQIQGEFRLKSVAIGGALRF